MGQSCLLERFAKHLLVGLEQPVIDILEKIVAFFFARIGHIEGPVLQLVPNGQLVTVFRVLVQRMDSWRMHADGGHLVTEIGF